MNFNPTQEEYNAWFKAKLKRVNDEEDYLFIDVNDAVMRFLCAHNLAEQFPQHAGKLAEESMAIVEDNELGMFAGATALAQLIGQDSQVGIDAMMAVFPK